MKTKIPFYTADILIPKNDHEKWSVIACDQFTSDTAYWRKTEQIVGDANSALKITLPEIYLENDDFEQRIDNINSTMRNYLNNGVLEQYKDCMIYIERTQPDGRVRAGILGTVDLEAYDYRKGSNTLIRATEGTVLERIPPRVQIRKNAPLEAPHVILLIDDLQKTVIEPLSKEKENMTKIYDFDLMMEGGHITGYVINKENIEKIHNSLEKLCQNEENPLLFAVGDGNHSLATAKECYDLSKKTSNSSVDIPERYALVEIENIHSNALDFEPIYRVLFSVDPENVLRELKKYFNDTVYNSRITYIYGEKEGSVNINIPSDKLSTGVIQDFIDSYIKMYPDTKIDYIHGTEDVRELSKQKNTIGFIYDGISKNNLFEMVKATGALPRKTFSMGEARDKRYYLECRKIR